MAMDQQHAASPPIGRSGARARQHASAGSPAFLPRANPPAS